MLARKGVAGRLRNAPNSRQAGAKPALKGYSSWMLTSPTVAILASGSIESGFSRFRKMDSMFATEKTKPTVTLPSIRSWVQAVCDGIMIAAIAAALVKIVGAV